MDDRMKKAQGLLREVARTSDDAAAGRSTARAASQRALAGWEARRTKRSAARPLVWSLAAIAAVLVLIGALWIAPREEMSFVIVPPGAAETAGEVGKVGAWIASPPGGLSLRFSEGSEITLRAGASARVARADERGADVLLERGALDASVVHRDPSTGWAVRAGPFEIRVVGTRFDASWEPASGTLDVHVSEGRVIVVGPLLDEGRGVSADERLRVSLQTSRLEMLRTPSAYAGATGALPPAVSADPALPAVSAEPAPAVSVDPAPAERPGEPAGAGGAGSAPGHSTAGHGGEPAAAPGTARPASPGGADWRELARAGRHRAAVDAAVAQGFDGVLAGAPAADLLLLADSARFAGETGRARQALLAARARGGKGSTAFLLGKIAADSAATPGEAAQWFETYLAEAPSGALAEQALGRLMEAHRRAGQTAAARAAATRYLEKYPSGGYASAARTLLDP